LLFFLDDSPTQNISITPTLRPATSILSNFLIKVKGHNTQIPLGVPPLGFGKKFHSGSYFSICLKNFDGKDGYPLNFLGEVYSLINP
jgi:hypothetical protein